MLRRGVSKKPDYGDLFQAWEIAVAKNLINEFKDSSGSIRREDFEDLLQECLIHWYLNKNSYNPKREASEKTYMGRIVRNKLIDLVREKESDKRKISYLALSLDEPLGDEDGFTLIDKLEEGAGEKISLRPPSDIDISVDLKKAFEKLKPNQKKLCHWLGHKGFTVMEVSEDLKIPRSTIYDELVRIRAIFKKEGLDDYLK